MQRVEGYGRGGGKYSSQAQRAAAVRELGVTSQQDVGGWAKREIFRVDSDMSIRLLN